MDSKELHGARSLVESTVWSRENPLFPAHHVSSRSQHSPSNIEKCGIMLVFKEVVFLCMTCTAVTVAWTNRTVFDNLQVRKTRA